MSKKIFLVEDEITLSQMYQTKFEKEGYQVIIAADGGEILKKIKAAKPDIILLDIVLPKSNGFTILEEIKKNKTTSKIPVIMLTNLGQEEDIKKGKELGADGYIVKADSTPAQVMENIKAVLE